MGVPDKKVYRFIIPSMGPQHVRCGMHDLRVVSGQAGMPSMGPQHVRCGMSEICLMEFMVFVHPSMGPQHVRCGMCLHGLMGVHALSPSMGPQHVRCGMHIPISDEISQRLLQWGRNMFVAEWNPRRANTVFPVTFNGAATCSLRNVA